MWLEQSALEDRLSERCEEWRAFLSISSTYDKRPISQKKYTVSDDSQGDILLLLASTIPLISMIYRIHCEYIDHGPSNHMRIGSAIAKK